MVLRCSCNANKSQYGIRARLLVVTRRAWQGHRSAPNQG